MLDNTEFLLYIEFEQISFKNIPDCVTMFTVLHNCTKYEYKAVYSEYGRLHAN